MAGKKHGQETAQSRTERRAGSKCWRRGPTSMVAKCPKCGKDHREGKAQRAR